MILDQPTKETGTQSFEDATDITKYKGSESEGKMIENFP